MIIDAIVLGVILSVGLYTKDKNKFYLNKTNNIVTIIFSALSAFFFIFAIIFSIGLLFGEDNEVFTLNLRKTITEGAFLFAVPFLAILLPKIPCKTRNALISLLVVVTIIMGVNAFFPLTPYKITSTPMVIDNGNEFSIVFSTNDYGTAFVEYNYKGKDYKVFDNTGGRLNSDSKIHSIAIPYEHLKNNSYKVGSTRVIEEFSYGSRTGKTVTSQEYNLTYNDSKNQTWLVISDWHTLLDKATTAINCLESDYDAVIMLGDASPGVDFEEQVVSNTVQFGGQISGGTKPVIYARGNHETRGSYAKDLSVALGLEQFYYTTDIGPYSFVVLDSGEDKDDSHIEYGGMNDYNTYRADMIEWLKGVNTNSNKVITLCHAWEISSVEEELSVAGWNELDRLGADLMISGHEHSCRFIDEANDKEKEHKENHPDTVTYIDGGKSGDEYIASLLTLNDIGFEIRAVNTKGDEVINETFNWPCNAFKNGIRSPIRT